MQSTQTLNTVSDNSIKNVDFVDLVSEVRKNLVFIFICALSCGLTTLSLCYLMQPWFSYNGLIKVADLGILNTASLLKDASSASKLPFGLGGAGDTLKNEVTEYIRFKYIEPQRESGSLDPFVKTAYSSKNANLIYIDSRATSLEASKNFLDEVLRDLNNYFNPKFETTISEGKERSKLLRERISFLEKEVNEVRSAMAELGFSPTMRIETLELEKQITLLRGELLQIQSALGPDKIYNFGYISTAPYHPFKPIFPRKGLFSIAGFLAGGLAAIYIVVARRIFQK